MNSRSHGTCLSWMNDVDDEEKRNHSCSEQNHDCSSHQDPGVGVDGVYQTLQEMDFQRGPWGAASCGDYREVSKYLQKGGAPNIRDTAGYAPIHYAARHGYQETVDLLLSHGAFVDMQTKSGKATPLHKAAIGGHDNVVALLLKKGANPRLQDADGKTALHKAVDAKSGKVCQLLMDHDPKCAEIQDKNFKEPKYYIRDTCEYAEVYKAVKWSRNPKKESGIDVTRLFTCCDRSVLNRKDK